LVSLGALTFFILMGIIGPLVYRVNPLEPSSRPFLLPSLGHPMGTDNLGRDILALFLSGARVSVEVGFFAVGATLLVGIIIGSLAGYFGGWVDAILMRVTELFLVLPTLLLAIVLVAAFGPSLLNIIISISVVTWPRTARLLRGEFLKLREAEFVDAATVMGKSNPSIIFGEILPNALTPVITNSSFEIGNAIIIEASLSFLGLGDPSHLSWGFMIMNSVEFLQVAPWMALFPGIGLTIVVLSLNFLGDALDDILSPNKR
jgi:peptide/nickel transport system permease protein